MCANFNVLIYLQSSNTYSLIVVTFAGIVRVVIVLSSLSPTYSTSTPFFTLYKPSIISLLCVVTGSVGVSVSDGVSVGVSVGKSDDVSSVAVSTVSPPLPVGTTSPESPLPVFSF